MGRPGECRARNSARCLCAAEVRLALLRRAAISAAAILCVLTHGTAARADAGFDRWREQLRTEAQKRGITPAIFDRATDVQPDLSLPDLVIPGRPIKEQAE